MKKKVVARTDIKENPPILISKDLCDLCGACISVCPPDCIEMNHDSLRIVGEDCIRCGFCLPVCPLAALSWVQNSEEED